MDSRRIAASAGMLCTGIAILAATAATQSKPAQKPASRTETGYVVSSSEAALVLSNLAPRSGGGGPAGGPGGAVFTRQAGPGGAGDGSRGDSFQVRLGPGDVVVAADGKRSLSPEAKKRFTPEQARMIEQDLNNAPREGGPVVREGGGGQMQFQLGPGDVVRGPDGKMTLSAEAKKRFSPEQQQRIQETLINSSQSGHGPAIVRKGPGGEPGDSQVQPGKTSAPSAPLQLTDFVLDKKTKLPKDLAQGDKVKVTYVEADGKKLATKIEKAT